MSNSYHFIGIGGIGMSGLAHLLLRQKIQVTGSDLACNAITEKLTREGAVIYRGHAEQNVPSEATVVYSTDIKSNNPEYQAAIKMGNPLLHRSDLLARLIKDQQSLAVAGTHGKTTTSSLLATVLVEAGWDPSCAIGGMVTGFQSNARFGKGKFFVLEADESDRSFLKYSPFGAIVTNIDCDHLEYYEGDLAVLINHFKMFMSQVQDPHYLFWCRDDVHLTAIDFSGQTYGFHPESDWRIENVRQEEFKMVFDLSHQEKVYSNIELALTGEHYVSNGAAVFGLSLTLGVPEEKIRKAFRDFQGVLRRCENKGSANHILFIDDYAHHPTEIRVTLKSIKQAIGSRRLIAVFQPHRYTRTQFCLGLYGTIFEDADALFITEIYGAGEAPISGVSSERIQKEIANESATPCHLVSRLELSRCLSEYVKPYDVVVTLGAGDITKVASETIPLIQKAMCTVYDG